jgi:hypothetical protein
MIFFVGLLTVFDYTKLSSCMRKNYHDKEIVIAYRQILTWGFKIGSAGATELKKESISFFLGVINGSRQTRLL